MEVCVDNLQSVSNALAGGAKRLELCSALSEGGLTPTIGFVKQVCVFFNVAISMGLFLSILLPNYTYLLIKGLAGIISNRD